MKLSGVSYRTLDYWARTGLLRPSFDEANGTGTERVYSFQDVVILSALVSIANFTTLPNRTQAAVVSELQQIDLESEFRMLVIGKHIRWVAGISMQYLFTPDERVVAVLDFGRLLRDLRERLK